MPRTTLTRTRAKANAIREVCIDSQEDIWVKIKMPSPRILMDFENADQTKSMRMVFELVKTHLIEPRIVENPTNEFEVTEDEIGGYFLAIATAIMDSVDPSGDARKKAESFLANQSSPNGSNGSVGVLHASNRPSGV